MLAAMSRPASDMPGIQWHLVLVLRDIIMLVEVLSSCGAQRAGNCIIDTLRHSKVNGWCAKTSLQCQNAFSLSPSVSEIRLPV